MSILGALKTQTESLDDLAALPQAMIMQMAQKGQIREDMLAPILGRKAELADAVARTKALQGQGGQMPTVMEQLMQRNAEAEMPEPQEQQNVGVAQLPVREDMFQEQSMASGGIVAFAPGGEVYDDPLMEFSGMGTESMELDKARIAKLLERRKSEEDKARYEFLKKSAPETAARMLEEKPALGLEAIKPVVDVKPDVAAKPIVPATGNVTTKAVKKDEAKAPASPLEDLFTRQEKLIESERADSKAAREEAKWMRVIEAGLGIMGGASPYAAQNIGKGAAAALKGYGEDVAGLRKEERQRTKDLMEIQKERADMGYKDKLLEIQRLAATKPDSTAQIVALGRKAGLDERQIIGLLAGNKDTENSAKNIATKAFFENPMLQQKHGTLDKYLSAQGFGVQAQLPPGIPPNSVLIGTSKGKPVYRAPDGKQYVVS
jgi:hypothetical protein